MEQILDQEQSKLQRICDNIDQTCVNRYFNQVFYQRL